MRESRDYLMKCLLFVLLFGFISLGAIGGCNNNGGGGGDGDLISEACSICPCKYFDVPTTTGCWKEPALESEPSGPSFCLLADIASTGEPLMLVTTVEFACQIL